MAAGSGAEATQPGSNGARDERRIIVAASLGTAFEWYDFFLYATLAPFFAVQFFPAEDANAALLAAFAAYAAGFLLRPVGALVFGRIGDRSGRRPAFVVTIAMMGGATFAVGALPTYAQIGWLAPALLVALRLLQGLALGGEYGGAATFVAERARPGRRGRATSWVQTTGTLGFFASLLVVGACRFGGALTPEQFAAWGWRIPFLISLFLLVYAVHLRRRLDESPVFLRLRARNEVSPSPVVESVLRLPNSRRVLVALLGATAGQGAVWTTGQFYALAFLTDTLRLDTAAAYAMIAIALALGAPFFVVFGALSDRFGRVRIVLAGCLLASLTYFPLFAGLAHFVNPALERFQAAHPITLRAADCSVHVFVGPWSRYSECDRAQAFLAKAGLSFTTEPATTATAVGLVATVGDSELRGFDPTTWTAALAAKGLPASAAPAEVDWPMALFILWLMMLYATMVYGPIAAFLAETFPTRVRYTSLSFTYHLGNGWFGGMVPLLAMALATAHGDITYGLWYPVAIALLTFVVGVIFLEDRTHFDLEASDAAYR